MLKSRAWKLLMRILRIQDFLVGQFRKIYNEHTGMQILPVKVPGSTVLSQDAMAIH